MHRQVSLGPRLRSLSGNELSSSSLGEAVTELQLVPGIDSDLQRNDGNQEHGHLRSRLH